MAVSPFKTFVAAEILTAADLNDSFSQVFDNGEDLPFPASKAKDFNGHELVLDADGDTVMVSDVDDQVDIKPSATLALQIKTNNVTVKRNFILNKGSDIASATALTIGNDGGIFDVTGTTTITSIGTLGIGSFVILQFDGALTIQHDAVTGNIVLPGGNDITTSAGDHVLFYEYDTGKWRAFSTTIGTPKTSLGMWFGGAPTAGGILAGHVFDKAVTFPASLTNSRAHALVAATDGLQAVDIQKNGSSVGSADFSVGVNAGAFTFTAETAFAAGDRITFVAPTPADSTLADIMITLQGTRT